MKGKFVGMNLKSKYLIIILAVIIIKINFICIYLYKLLWLRKGLLLLCKIFLPLLHDEVSF